MADSSAALERPLSLETFLDAGGDLTAPDIWQERLAEVVYLDLPLLPTAERAKRAAEARAKALDLACSPPARGRRRQQHEEQQRERILYWHWVADLYEAPELAERLAAAPSTRRVGRTVHLHVPSAVQRARDRKTRSRPSSSAPTRR